MFNLRCLSLALAQRSQLVVVGGWNQSASGIHTSAVLELVVALVTSLRIKERGGSKAMKKSHRENVSVAKNREERKRKKILKRMREIRMMPKMQREIIELEEDKQLMEQLSERTREPPVLSEDEQDRRARIFKDWAAYCARIDRMEHRSLCARVKAQSAALTQLRMISPRLYQAAIQPDMSILDKVHQGVRYTPPIKNYELVDGNYEETTKKYAA